MYRKLMTGTISLAVSIAVAGSAFAGNVVGTVKYAGTAPAPKKIEKTKDQEICGKLASTAEDLIVGAGGGLKNAVVMVNVPGAKSMPVPASNAIVDQKGCWFQPHIQIVAAGQKVDIVNDDGILHNIHTSSKLNAPCIHVNIA